MLLEIERFLFPPFWVKYSTFHILSEKTALLQCCIAFCHAHFYIKPFKRPIFFLLWTKYSRTFWLKYYILMFNCKLRELEYTSILPPVTSMITSPFWNKWNSEMSDINYFYYLHQDLCFQLCQFVCLFVCLSPGYLKKYWTDVHLSFWKSWP